MIEEVILVINFNVEGEVMVMYILCLLKFLGIKVIRIVYGFLVGGDLEYVDEVMFLKVMEGWREV